MYIPYKTHRCSEPYINEFVSSSDLRTKRITHKRSKRGNIMPRTIYTLTPTERDQCRAISLEEFAAKTRAYREARLAASAAWREARANGPTAQIRALQPGESAMFPSKRSTQLSATVATVRRSTGATFTSARTADGCMVTRLT